MTSDQIEIEKELAARDSFKRQEQIGTIKTMLQGKPGKLDVEWLERIQKMLEAIVPEQLTDLSQQSRWEIYTTMEVRPLQQHNLVFSEGDDPDGFYVILAGEVSIHKQGASAKEDDGTEKIQTAKEREIEQAHGTCLAKLTAGQSFGELAYSSLTKGRAATVVASGDVELSRLTAVKSDDDLLPPTICLVVPSDIFAQQLNEKVKLFDAKLAFVQNSLLFAHWPLERAYELASAMGHRILPKRSTLALELSFIVEVCGERARGRGGVRGVGLGGCPG